MDTQALLIWPTLHSIAEPFKLQADTLGVHLKWADDIYTEFFPDFLPADHYLRDEMHLSNIATTSSRSRPTSHRERAKSMKVDNDDVKSDIADYLAMSLNSQKKGQHNPVTRLDTPPIDAFAAAAAAERNKNNVGGIDVPSLGGGINSMHSFPGV